MDASISELYGNKIRIRVCGILLQNNSFLLVNHKNLTPSNIFWAPPGGGLKFGESLTDCLRREFKEETNLDIEVLSFITATEYIKPPLHAIELFYAVEKKSNDLKKGIDPELPSDKQIIDNVAFVSVSELIKIPLANKHRVLEDIVFLKSRL